MGGKSNKFGSFGLAVQTGKGVTAANPSVKFYLADGLSNPVNRELARFASTDGTPDRGALYVSQVSAALEVPIYLQKGGIALPFYGAMGAVAHSGIGPYTHTHTLADDLPWLTGFLMRGNDIFEVLPDLKLNTLGLEGAAGGPLIARLGILGLDVDFANVDTALTPLSLRDAAAMGLLFRESAGALKVDTVAQKLERFGLTISNQLALRQANDLNPYEIVRNGEREIDGSYAFLYQGPTTFPAYRNEFYGSAAGTDLSAVIARHAHDWTFTRDAASNQLGLLMPDCVYSAVPIPIGTGGETILVEGEFSVEKPAAGQQLTATVKDETATF